MTDTPSDPATRTVLPDDIRERLRQEAERTAAPAGIAAIGARLIGTGAAAFGRVRGAAANLRSQAIVARVLTHGQRVTDARPTWLSWRRIGISQDVRGEIVDRGRRAGVSIGTTLDKIVRQMPQDRPASPAPMPALQVDADIATMAVQRAVRQPSVFEPGHLLTALLTGGIVHIMTTFSITALGTGGAYRSLRGVLPANEFVVMPAQSPGTQVLPYLQPDMLYAFCRFDLTRGPIEVSARLPEAGWSLALYTRQGDNFYAVPGQSQRPTVSAFVLAPASDRLINLQPGVRKTDVDLSQVTSPDQEGLLVIRAPLKGVAFEGPVQAELKRARCAPRAALRP